jgi:hypothetical protein
MKDTFYSVEFGKEPTKKQLELMQENFEDSFATTGVTKVIGRNPKTESAAELGSEITDVLREKYNGSLLSFLLNKPVKPEKQKKKKRQALSHG